LNGRKSSIPADYKAAKSFAPSGLFRIEPDLCTGLHPVFIDYTPSGQTGRMSPERANLTAMGEAHRTSKKTKSALQGRNKI
jgi:hypothetical protein